MFNTLKTRMHETVAHLNQAANCAEILGRIEEWPRTRPDLFTKCNDCLKINVYEVIKTFIIDRYEMTRVHEIFINPPMRCNIHSPQIQNTVLETLNPLRKSVGIVDTLCLTIEEQQKPKP